MFSRLWKKLRRNTLINNIYDILKTIIILLITFIGDVIWLLLISSIIALFIFLMQNK
jgi:hypothetical protein